MNSYTETPVNSVWFDAILSLILGLLAFAGPQAINAVFATSVTAVYVAYAIPIMARFMCTNDFKPGPFSLGIFVRSQHCDNSACCPKPVMFLGLTGSRDCCSLHGLLGNCISLPNNSTD